MNFNNKILYAQPLHIAETGENKRLLGDTVEEAIQKINQATLSPPRFRTSKLTGLPILALFMDYMHTTEGQNFFMNEKVNKCLK